jgi:hypothetical protein
MLRFEMRLLGVMLLAIIYSQSIQLGILRFEMRLLGVMLLGTLVSDNIVDSTETPR